MIFRRGRKKGDEPGPDGPVDEEEVDPDTASPVVSRDSQDLPAGEPGEVDVAKLDAQFWRGDGPHDISEVDLEEMLDGEQPRIDLGSMILTGFPGAELRLSVAEDTSELISAMLASDSSALELGAYAAPRSGGFWAELRDEMSQSAVDAGGSASAVEGPFGVELRRLVPVTTPEGEEGYVPSRMWVAEGPRWLLRGIVYGQAALEEGVDPPVAELLTAFRSVVVRRGDEAMAPGDLLPLSMPENLVAAEPDQPA